MNRQFSIYLDLLRFTAAVLVFIAHAPSVPGGWLWQLKLFAHEAVVFFFILSGFVIAYVVFEKKESAYNYSINRFARIYSVALPALILSILLYYIGYYINSQPFLGLEQRFFSPLWTIFSSLFFLNQSWIDTPVFSNLPYWSLGYEVLYYVFFGALIFVSGYKKYIILFLIILIMGPSVILYLPIWLLGVLCFKNINRFNVSINFSILIFVISVLGMGYFSLSDVQYSINIFIKNLINRELYGYILLSATKFASDYVLAIFVSLHLYSAYHLSKRVNLFNDTFSKRIRLASSHTFSLYHMPLLYFIAALIPIKKYQWLNFLFCWVVVPLFIFILSIYTERSKNSYKTFFVKLTNKLQYKSKV
jgi:peptidoglycan/LPS O-acetylase OafA/YrhL